MTRVPWSPERPAAAPLTDERPAPRAPGARPEERPAQDHTRYRETERAWLDGMLLINLTPSQRRDGNLLTVDDDGMIREYETGEIVLVTGRKLDHG